MKSNKEKVTKSIKSFAITNPLTLKYLSYLLSSISISILPILFFLIFMYEKSFFSYDFFTQGLFGMKIFFFFSLFIISLMSLFMFYFIPSLTKILYIKHERRLVDLNKKEDKIEDEKHVKQVEKITNKLKSSYSSFWTSLVFSTLSTLIIYLTFSLKENVGFFFYLWIICLCISIHISVLWYGKIAHQFISLLSVLFIILVITLLRSNYTAKMIDSGLRQFGVGGDIGITLFSKFSDSEKLNDVDKVSGKLVLLSPQHIYFRLDDNNSIRVIDRNNVYAIKLETPVKKQ